MKKRVLIKDLKIVFAIIMIGTALYLKPQQKSAEGLQSLPLDKKLTIVTGGGGNSGILQTDKGIVVIDTKMAANSEELFNLVKQKAGDKKGIVINTHYHMDHTGGNHLYKGDKIYIGDYNKAFLEKQLKPEDMPTDFIKDQLSLNMGDETVEIYNMGQAHTYKDLVVYLKNRKILFTGDLVFDKVNPVLKRESGANVNNWLSVLFLMNKRWDVKTYVPGHGPTGGKEIVKIL
jgi:cyclase